MSIFTRRHYEFLTQVSETMLLEVRIRHHNMEDYAKAHDETAAAIKVLANALESESLGFDKRRFLNEIFGHAKIINF